MRLHVSATTWLSSGRLTQDKKDKKFWYSLNTRLDGPQRWYGRLGKEKKFSPVQNRTTKSRLPS